MFSGFNDYPWFSPIQNVLYFMCLVLHLFYVFSVRKEIGVKHSTYHPIIKQ